MKVYVDILGSIIEIKKGYQWFIKGERYHVITREESDAGLKYELELMDGGIPTKRIWCGDSLLVTLRKNKTLEI